MTIHQQRSVNDVRECIRHIRNTLDGVMYGEPEITEPEYQRLRKAYDLICQANDAL